MTVSIEDLKGLFTARRAAYNKSTDEILDALQSTLLTAAEEHFQMKIEWIEVLLLNDFITAVGTVSDNRIVRVVVPPVLLEKSKDEIVQFFQKMEEEEIKEPVQTNGAEVQFGKTLEDELPDLSDEQKEKLSIFEKTQTKGKIH